MKIINSFILLAILFVANGCQTCEKQDITEIYCFVDVTDEVNLELAKEYFKAGEDGCKFYSSLAQGVLPKSNCTGLKFSFLKLNDLGESGKVKWHYPKSGVFEADLTDVQIKQEPLFKNFKTQLSTKFDELIKGESSKKDKTKIYLPLCKALTELSKSKSSRKIMVIFSDMIENSELFSMYKMKGIKPDEILIQLESTFSEKIPDLKDIEIYIVSKRNKANDEIITLAEEFWKELFTGAFNAKVYKCSANLEME